MYKIGYEVQLEDTECGFAISSYDYDLHRETIRTCPAIKMTVETCESKEAVASYYEAMYPYDEVENLPKDFHEHFREILDCCYDGWKLVTIWVKPAELDLEYYCLATEEKVSVNLDIKRSRIRILELNIEVPTLDGSSIATYHIELEVNAIDAGGEITASTLIQAEYPHLRQRRVFMLSTLDPYNLSVSDIYDL